MGQRVNRSQLAEIMGVDPKTITAWSKEEGFPVLLAGKRGTGNVYDSAAVIEWRIRREIAKYASPEGQELLDLEQERAHLARAQRVHTNLKSEILRKNLVPAEIMASTIRAVIGAAKARLMSARNRIAQQCPAAPPEVLQIVDDQIDDALNQLRSGDLPSDLRGALEQHLQRMATAAAPESQ